MSALGQKQTCAVQTAMSALPPNRHRERHLHQQKTPEFSREGFPAIKLNSVRRLASSSCASRANRMRRGQWRRVGGLRKAELGWATGTQQSNRRSLQSSLPQRELRRCRQPTFRVMPNEFISITSVLAALGALLGSAGPQLQFEN